VDFDEPGIYLHKNRTLFGQGDFMTTKLIRLATEQCGRWAISAICMLVISLTACASHTKGAPIDVTSTATAILLVDFQEDFLGEEAAMPVDSVQGMHARSAASNLLAMAKQEGLPVILIGNEFPESALLANFFRRNAAVAGQPGTDLIKEVPRGAGTYFSKAHADAFTNAELDAHLREIGIGQLVIAGVFADNCVLATVRGARQRGFSVSVVEDGVATGNAWRLRRAFSAYRKAGASVVPIRGLDIP
jgi:nicotinamidase-related amidase